MKPHVQHMLLSAILVLALPIGGVCAQSMGSNGGIDVFQGQNTANQSGEPAPTSPKIKLCTLDDVKGMHYLVRVFETPEGARTQDFKNFPYQYIRFHKNKTFGEVKSKKAIKRRSQVNKRIINSQKDNLMQFVIGDKGALFIYKNQTFSHSYYCGISENDAGVYKAGDIVLTPTSTDRKELFELYRRVR